MNLSGVNYDNLEEKNMDPEFEYTYGPNDDRRMPPGKISKAYGIVFDPPLNAQEAIKLMVQTNAECTKYIKSVTQANARLKSLLEKKPASTNPDMKKFTEATILHMLELHRAETGEHIVIVKKNEPIGKTIKNAPSRKDAAGSEPQPQPEQPEQPEVTGKSHKQLVKELKAHTGGLPPNDVNRHLMIQTCEGLVRELGTAKRMQLTPERLWAHSRTKHPFLYQKWKEALVPTLVAEGWVLSEGKDDSVVILPHDDHPMWETI